MLEKMFDILARESMCVLATDHGGRPHCSLMAYMFDRQGRALVMVTGKNSGKYRNMRANRNVSLLVDTRTSAVPGEQARIQALTVAGVFEPQDPRDLLELKRSFLAAHPHLKELLEQEETEFFRIHIHSLQLLDGPVDASFIPLD